MTNLELLAYLETIPRITKKHRYMEDAMITGMSQEHLQVKIWYSDAEDHYRHFYEWISTSDLSKWLIDQELKKEVEK